MATSEQPKPAGLFLRYCAPCNSTQIVAVAGKKGLKCEGCGADLATVDAHALIPALGRKINAGLREHALAEVADHTLPRST